MKHTCLYDYNRTNESRSSGPYLFLHSLHHLDIPLNFLFSLHHFSLFTSYSHYRGVKDPNSLFTIS